MATPIAIAHIRRRLDAGGRRRHLRSLSHQRVCLLLRVPTGQTPRRRHSRSRRCTARYEGQTPEKTAFYAIVGMVLSVCGAGLYSSMQRRSQRIEQLSAALQSDLHTLIAQGESAQPGIQVVVSLGSAREQSQSRPGSCGDEDAGRLHERQRRDPAHRRG